MQYTIILRHPSVFQRNRRIKVEKAQIVFQSYENQAEKYEKLAEALRICDAERDKAVTELQASY